jgi:hypothetical protein
MSKYVQNIKNGCLYLSCFYVFVSLAGRALLCHIPSCRSLWQGLPVYAFVSLDFLSSSFAGCALLPPFAGSAVSLSLLLLLLMAVLCFATCLFFAMMMRVLSNCRGRVDWLYS